MSHTNKSGVIETSKIYTKCHSDLERPPRHGRLRPLHVDGFSLYSVRLFFLLSLHAWEHEMCVLIALVGPRGMCCDHDGSELKRLFASAHAAGPCPFGLSFFNRSMEIQRSGQLSFFFFLHF